MKMQFKIGDITFDGGKINGIEAGFEFASIQEYKDYLAVQKETLEELKSFLKTDIPEIITAAAKAFEKAMEDAEDTEYVVGPKFGGLGTETKDAIRQALDEFTKLHPKTEGPGLKLKEVKEPAMPLGFKIAEKTAPVVEDGPIEIHEYKYSDHYESK